MKEYFEKDYRPTAIVIRTSPFIKSIMTAFFSLCHLIHRKSTWRQNPDNGRVEIDSNLAYVAEVLTKKKFDCNPLPELEISKCHSKKDIENLKRKYKID